MKGYTIKWKLKKFNGILQCVQCLCPFENHYYTHQCIHYPHTYCYKCLENKGRCKKCGKLYTRMLIPMK